MMMELEHRRSLSSALTKGVLGKMLAMLGRLATLAATALPGSATPITVYQPKTIGSPTLPATRTNLTATSSLLNGSEAQVYKPWAALLPSGEILVVAFCAMGFGPGQCHFPNGTAAECEPRPPPHLTPPHLRPRSRCPVITTR